MSLTNSLKALADENRLKMLRLLLNGDLCVGALAKHLGISTPAVSQHLQILRKAGLVRGEKRGYWTHYKVNRQRLDGIASKLQTLSADDQNCNIMCLKLHETPKNKTKQKEDDMCQSCCRQPDRLEDKPENCRPEQIHECHGDAGKHPCTPGQQDPQHKKP